LILNDLNDKHYEQSTEEILIDCIKQLSSVEIDPDSDSQTKVNLIVDQIKRLLAKSKKAYRYCADSLLMAFVVRNISSAAYNALRKHWNLPCLTKLNSLAKAMDVMNDDKYFKRVYSQLKPHERRVNLLIDEVRLKESIDYKNICFLSVCLIGTVFTRV
jgi:23S rRNA A2030 N6-methylase RlmJ